VGTGNKSRFRRITSSSHEYVGFNIAHKAAIYVCLKARCKLELVEIASIRPAGISLSTNDQIRADKQLGHFVARNLDRITFGRRCNRDVSARAQNYVIHWQGYLPSPPCFGRVPVTTFVACGRSTACRLWLFLTLDRRFEFLERVWSCTHHDFGIEGSIGHITLRDIASDYRRLGR